jgi:branched-chain amino acid transport system substrate-binding protein
MKKHIWTGVSILVLALGAFWFYERPATSAIKIGALLPLTGKLASYGEDMRNALTLANEELAASGKTSFDFVFEDSAGDPKTALSAARKLIEIDNIPLIIGAPGSSANLAVAPVFEEHKTLFFPLSNAPKLNDAGEYIFKVNPDIDVEVARMSAYVKGQEFKRLAVLYDASNDVPTVGSALFRELVTKSGATVVFFEGVDGKTVTDFRTQLTSIKKAAPDALYVIIADKLAGVVVRQAQELGLATPILGWSSFNAQEFFSGGGEHTEGVVITDQPFSCDGTVRMKDYCAAYKAQFAGRQPTLYGAEVYDLLHAFSGVLEGHTEIGEAEKTLVQRAFTGKTYDGVNEAMSFDERGNVRVKEIVLRVAKDGKFVNLK